MAIRQIFGKQRCQTPSWDARALFVTESACNGRGCLKQCFIIHRFFLILSEVFLGEYCQGMEPAEGSAARVSLLLGITDSDQLLVEMEEVGSPHGGMNIDFFLSLLPLIFIWNIEN